MRQSSYELTIELDQSQHTKLVTLKYHAFLPTVEKLMKLYKFRGVESLRYYVKLQSLVDFKIAVIFIKIVCIPRTVDKLVDSMLQ